MPQTHKLVRDAIEAVMRDDSNGFNVKLAAVLPDYGITEPIALNWSAGVMYARLAEGAFKTTGLDGRLTLEIAPDGSQWTGETRGVKWSGVVGVRLLFRLTYSFSDGEDSLPDINVLTATATAIEDTVIEVFQRPIAWPNGVVYAKPPDCPEGYIPDEQDNSIELLIPISVGFKIVAV